MISDSPRQSTSPRQIVEVALSHASEDVDTEYIRALVQYVAAAESVKIDHIAIILCGRAEHLALHRRYLGNHTPTDVLAFDMEPQSGLLEAEIYVDLDTARERHEEFDATFDEEVARYIVHGFLHLVGYMDKNEADARKMISRQEGLLKAYRESRSEVD